MNKVFFYFALLILLVTGSVSTAQENQKTITYELDLKNYSDDLFHVTIYPPLLTDQNNIYSFAVTAPGVYKVLDFGRFVKSFECFDTEGNKINTEIISTNKWKISEPGKAVKIIYTIEDSYDADIKENLISPMEGTAIDSNFALVNNFGVFGYFENMQKNPIRLKILYPEKWIAGTALDLSDDGYYYSESYDHFADSPILLGNLTVESTSAGQIKVDMFTFSDSEDINADTLLKLSEPILNASAEFIGYAPVNRYSFLMIYMSMDTYQRQNLWGAGALEHSYSSVYGMPITPDALSSISGTISHEFFHIMTPLNLHSDLIENYNWSVPVASQHLWMYEGLTEWASGILQLRAGLISVEQYLRTVTGKINTSKRLNDGISLAEVSREIYKPDMLMQFLNFYEKGSLVNTMLDILLLDLSDGRRGLREVFVDLSKEFGKTKSFKDDEFFDIFVDRTYPEVAVFFEKYVEDTLDLPIAEYFNKIGIKLIPERIPENSPPRMGLSFMPSEDKEVMIQDVAPEAVKFGYQAGDILIKIFGENITFANFSELLERTKKMNIGDDYLVVVRRNGEEVSIAAKLIQRIQHNVLEPIENMSPRQSKLFKAWKVNLPL